MPSAKPSQPPPADMQGLIDRVTELSKKVLNKPFSSTLPKWKRWVGGEGEYDVTGLRDVVNADALMLDQVKQDGDTNTAAIVDLRRRVTALETQPSAPFPGSSSTGGSATASHPAP
jgi:hypothetical protein